MRDTRPSGSDRRAPGGFFPGVEPDSPVFPLLQGLRPRVEAEIARYEGADVTVQAEIRVAHRPTGGLGLERFYWSSQWPDPTAPFGFAARTLYIDGRFDEIQLHTFPSEPVLTWLGQDDGPLHRDAKAGRVELLRYIPLRRVTYRLHNGPELPATAIAKVKRPGGLRRAAAALIAVGSATGGGPSAPRLPTLLRLEDSLHVLYLDELPGDSLGKAVEHLDPAEAMQQLGELHRGLQQLEVEGVPVRRTRDWLDDARRAAGQVELLVPSLSDQVRVVLATLERNAPEDARLLFCQGDFLPSQVLCHPSGWAVIDFDDSRYADPLSDVAAMYAAMPRELAIPASESERARRVYLEAYADAPGEPFDDRRFQWFLAQRELTEIAKRLAKGRAHGIEAKLALDRLTVRPDGSGS